MEEISTSLKIGLTFLILASILITVFSVFTIVQTFSRDVYEEQARAINVSHNELRDIVNEYLPMLALDKAISDSYYGGATVICEISQSSYNNGKRTLTALSGHYAWSDVMQNNSGNVGCIRQIDYIPATNTLNLHLELGG